jgi:hypothetical protein
LSTEEPILITIDNAIFLAQFNDNFAPKISEAVLPLGLPKSSLPALIQGFSSRNTTALAAVSGATDKIIAAGLDGVKEAYVLGFRYVWVAAGCFTALAAICKCPFFSAQRSPNLRS